MANADLIQEISTPKKTIKKLEKLEIKRLWVNEALQGSESKYRAIVENINDAHNLCWQEGIFPIA